MKQALVSEIERFVVKLNYSNQRNIVVMLLFLSFPGGVDHVTVIDVVSADGRCVTLL